MTTVVFSHGQESGPWGMKIRSLAGLARSRGLGVESIDYRGIVDPRERVEKLLREAAQIDDTLLLVGSSMGAYVATAAAAELSALGLFVLAPAYYVEDLAMTTPDPPTVPISIVHGWHDDVVPVGNSIRFARACSAALHVLDGDHRLTANIQEISGLFSHFITTLGIKKDSI